jgi:hypothetical protein
MAVHDPDELVELRVELDLPLLPEDPVPMSRRRVGFA